MMQAAALVWVRFRLPTPKLIGNIFDATASYLAGNQVYFASATTRGNFYDCVTAAGPGQSPDSVPAKWRIVELPLFLEEYLVQGAYADWLPGDGLNEKRNNEEAAAQRLLANQLMLFRGQQGQTERPVVGE